MKKLASIAVVLAVVATACGGVGGVGGGTTTGPSGQVKEGGFLRLAAFEGIDSLDPLVGRRRQLQRVRVHLPGARPVRLPDEPRGRLRDELGAVLRWAHLDLYHPA